MRTIGIVTAGRSDFGIYRPLIRGIQKDDQLSLSLFATGGHFSKKHGDTLHEIEKEGLPLTPIPVTAENDSTQAVTQTMGAIISEFSTIYKNKRPDILVVLGDRFEMMASALAAVPFGIPLAHIHGGEISEGAMDNVFRHAITKLSHLHFAATQTSAHRIIQMGEEPWRVTQSGALSLDNLNTLEFLDKQTLEQKLQITLDPAPVLVTYHPVTLELEQNEEHLSTLIHALSKIQHPLIITYPNVDMESNSVIQRFKDFAEAHANVRLVSNLGTQHYFSLMRIAHAMLGNSSSGIIEAASFNLPVINIGTRQQGRLHGENVLDVPCQETAILYAFDQISHSVFTAYIENMINPYGDGQTTPRILSVLKETPLDNRLMMKIFHEQHTQQETSS